MTSTDAWMFPVIGSGVLFGLFLVFRFFSKEYVNMLLTLYFLLFGVGAVTGVVSSILGLFSASDKTKKTGNESTTTNTNTEVSVDTYRYKFEMIAPWSNEKHTYQWNNQDILAFLIAAAITTWYGITKHWIANNILGLCFSIRGVALISVGSYKIGSLLLWGLFIYDIFWVFGTNVMVTVAKSFDAPIKVLMPKDFWADKYEFSLLGLGDIVLPGIFLALLLRFDVHRAGTSKVISKAYFWTSLIAYFIGLVVTIAIMHIFRHAQPALLYLVPFCSGVSFLTAVVRGELSKLLEYSEAVEEEEESDKNKDPKSVTTTPTKTSPTLVSTTTTTTTTTTSSIPTPTATTNTSSPANTKAKQAKQNTKDKKKQ